MDSAKRVVCQARRAFPASSGSGTPGNSDTAGNSGTAGKRSDTGRTSSRHFERAKSFGSALEALRHLSAYRPCVPGDGAGSEDCRRHRAGSDQLSQVSS
jgi:hypothetical protein